jgi:hypothetical protein
MWKLSIQELFEFFFQLFIDSYSTLILHEVYHFFFLFPNLLFPQGGPWERQNGTKFRRLYWWVIVDNTLFGQ